MYHACASVIVSAYGQESCSRSNLLSKGPKLLTKTKQMPSNLVLLNWIIICNNCYLDNRYVDVNQLMSEEPAYHII